MEKFDTRMIKAWVFLAIFWFLCDTSHGAEVPGFMDDQETSTAMADPVLVANEDRNGLRKEVEVAVGGIAKSTVGDRESAYSLAAGQVSLGIGPVDGAFKALHFAWDRPEDFIVGTNGRDPWNTLYEVSLGYRHPGAISEQLSYELLLGAASGFEKQLDGSFSFSAGGYILYELAPKWTLAAGVLASHHQNVNTDFDVIPILGISWNEKATSGLSFTLGLPASDVTWHFNEKTRVILELSSFEGGVFRLADNSPVQEKGYVELLSTSCTLRLETLLWERLQVSAGISQPISREMKLYDHQGENEKKFDVEKMPGFILSMSLPL
jgi:hypothetical protein